jgi:helix-turn-helix protein
MKNAPNNTIIESATEQGNNNTKCNETDNTDNSTAAQRQRLLGALRKGDVSTIQAMRDLDIMMPATRIFELKNHEGHEIETVRVTEETEAGKSHRVARDLLKARTDWRI